MGTREVGMSPAGDTPKRHGDTETIKKPNKNAKSGGFSDHAKRDEMFRHVPTRSDTN